MRTYSYTGNCLSQGFSVQALPHHEEISNTNKHTHPVFITQPG